MRTILPLAIGVEKYKKIIDWPYYYVDKTLLIKELLDTIGEVLLFTRPRRFGKTLTLSMLQTFFERELDGDGQAVDNSRYFAGKKIMDAGAFYTSHLGKYPVIFLSLKQARQPDFKTAYECIIEQISEEYKRHDYIFRSENILDSDKKRYRAIMEGQGTYKDYATSLAFLSGCLRKYHGQNVVVLIDEYDVPLENAWLRKFYPQMVDFIRSLFESALKTNRNLEFAVITGCLRISKESIFTGLNNMSIMSVLNVDFDEYFGFTESEVLTMLRNYGLEKKMEEVKSWYEGYLFGHANVYNPWSVLNYIKSLLSDQGAFPRPYWSNTSSNSIVRELIEKADIEAKEEIENLIAGGTIEKPVHEEITYEDVYDTQDNLWNFLFFTGYLKVAGQRFEDDTLFLALAIPNREVRTIYRQTIRKWFEQKVQSADLSPLYHAVFTGDCETFEAIIKAQLRDSISFWDSAESFYHGFMLGLLSPVRGQGYKVRSNFESGEGRSDLLLYINDEHRPAVIMEFKYCKKFSEMERYCKAALEQIRDRHYDAELLDAGYDNILRYGICFCHKRCKIKLDDIGKVPRGGA